LLLNLPCRVYKGLNPRYGFGCIFKVGMTMDKLVMARVKISKIMTKELVTTPLDSTVEEAVNKMVNYDVECLPVIDEEGVLQGLVTFRDIVVKVVYPSTNKKKLKVETIMSKNVVTCNPDSTVLDIAKIMKNKHLRRIPVVEAKNKLVGLVTDFDLALLGWDFK